MRYCRYAVPLIAVGDDSPKLAPGTANKLAIFEKPTEERCVD